MTSYYFAKDYTDWCRRNGIRLAQAREAADCCANTWADLERTIERRLAHGADFSGIRGKARELHLQSISVRQKELAPILDQRRNEQNKKPKTDTSQRKKRRCLSCPKSFMSDGPGNRICPTCKHGRNAHGTYIAITTQYEGF